MRTIHEVRTIYRNIFINLDNFKADYRRGADYTSKNTVIANYNDIRLLFGRLVDSSHENEISSRETKYQESFFLE
jgi:hypothetical protein